MGEMRPVLGMLLLLVGCGNGEGGRGTGRYDVLLRGGWIVDGSGNPRHRGDVAIAGDRIARLGFLPGAEARETLDVPGLVVAPGFIDMMGQSEINVLIDNRVLSKVTQGVTTEVTGEGGSVAPLTDRLVRDDSDAMKKWHYREDWRDLDGYIAQLERHGSTVNIATFVGATQVRLAVIGNANRQPTAPELAHMAALVDTLMEQGALGVWTALEYAPASYSTTNEIIALARAARRHGGIYASHMRNEGIQIDQALNELFRIAREAEIPAEVSHLKVSGRNSWWRMRRVLARIDSARASGLDVTADQYPYVAAATALDASIPNVGGERRLGLAAGAAARRQDAGAPARRDGAPHRRSRELLLRGGGRRGGVDHRDVSGLAALSPGQADQRDRRGAAPGSGGNGVRHRAR